MLYASQLFDNVVISANAARFHGIDGIILVQSVAGAIARSFVYYVNSITPKRKLIPFQSGTSAAFLEKIELLY